MSDDSEPLEGYLDVADWRVIAGWALNPARPEEPVWLECVIDDRQPIAFLANMLRPDLRRLGIGTGRNGFHLSLAAPLDATIPHQIVVRRMSDARPLINGVRLLERAPVAGQEVRAWIEAVVAAEIEAVTEAADLVPTMSFLIGQVDRLLSAHAGIANGAVLHERFRRRWEDTLEGVPKLPEPMPDPRPWALLIDGELPATQEALALVRALQRLGHRVAVVAAHGLPSHGPAAEALAAMDVAVHGRPLAFTVEDVLAREAGQYRCIVLRGLLLAASHGVVARVHNPRARIVACLPGVPAGRQEELLAVIAMLSTDHVVVPSEAVASELARRIAGRGRSVVDFNAGDQAVTEGLAASVGVRL